MKTSVLSTSMLEAWSSLPSEVRSALVACEVSGANTETTRQSSSVSSLTSSNSSDDSGEKCDQDSVIVEECPEKGTKVTLRPLELAPKNVFEFQKTSTRETMHVEKTPSSTVTTTTTIVTSSRGWRNVFTLPISYDVNMVQSGTLLDPLNIQLLESTGVNEEGYNRRFAVIDNEVERIYGSKIREYFIAHGIELTTCILAGGEPDKRSDVSFGKALFSLS